MATHVGNREINNVDCEIHATATGGWTIYRAGDEPVNDRFLASDEKSFDSAVNKARMAIKKQEVKVTVPFKTMDGKQGIATGRHARSRHKILATVGGKKAQIEYSQQILKHETPKDVVDHLTELREEQAKLSAEHRTLYSKWKMDLGTAVDDAIIKAIEEQAA
jgi:hypothetical protein